MYPSIHLSIYPSTHPHTPTPQHPPSLPHTPPIHLPTYPLIHPSTHPNIQPSNHPSCSPPSHPPIYPFTHLPTHPSINSPTHPPIHPSSHPSTHPATYPATKSPTQPPTHLPSHQPTHPHSHPSNNTPIYQYTHLPIHPSTNTPIYQYTHLPIQPFTQPFHPSTHPPLHHSTHLPIYPSTHPPIHHVCMHVCMYVCMFVCRYIFYFLGILCIFILLCPVYSAEVSRDIVKELESLIKQYKRKTFQKKCTKFSSVKEMPQERNVQNVIGKDGRDCAENCRLVYRGCLVTNGNMYNPICAASFVRCYPLCFTHNRTETVQNDSNGCTNSCSRYFDQCMLISSKTEEIFCLRIRNECRRRCPGSNVKKGCEEICAGDYDICEQAVQQILEIVTCQENRDLCKEKCWCMHKNILLHTVLQVLWKYC